MTRVLRWWLDELAKLLPAFVFFSIAFIIIIVTDALLVSGYRVNTFHVAAAFVLALIVSKSILIANALPFLDAFPRRPLVYNVAWKTAVYSSLALLFYFAERSVHLAISRLGLLAADPQLARPIPWSRFWMVLIWLIVTFLVFVSYTELDHKLGRGRLRRMFLGGDL